MCSFVKRLECFSLWDECVPKVRQVAKCFVYFSASPGSLETPQGRVLAYGVEGPQMRHLLEWILIEEWDCRRICAVRRRASPSVAVFLSWGTGLLLRKECMMRWNVWTKENKRGSPLSYLQKLPKPWLIGLRASVACFLLFLATVSLGAAFFFVGFLVVLVGLQSSLLSEMREKLSLAHTGTEKAQRTQSAFLATISHELRTPLNAIVGYAELLKEDYDALEENSEMERDIEQIQRAGRELMSHINTLLDLAEIEADQMTLQLAPFDVRELVDDIAWLHRAKASERGCTFDVQVQLKEHWVISDVTKLRKILHSLFENAVQFTRDRSIKVLVRQNTHQGQEFVEIALCDTELCLSEEQMEDVFGGFVQDDAASIRRHARTGLELVLCQKLALMLGGELTVSTSESQESRTTFLLRIAPHHPQTTREELKMLVMLCPEKGSRGLSPMFDNTSAHRRFLL